MPCPSVELQSKHLACTWMHAVAFVHCGQQHVSSPWSCDICCPNPCASPPNPECSQIFSHKCWPRQKPKPSLWRPGCDPYIYSKQMALLTKPDKLRWQSTICFVWTMCHLYIHEPMFFTNDCFNCRIKHEGPWIELPQHKNILLRYAALVDMTIFCCFDRRTICYWIPAHNHANCFGHKLILTNNDANVWPLPPLHRDQTEYNLETINPNHMYNYQDPHMYNYQKGFATKMVEHVANNANWFKHTLRPRQWQPRTMSLESHY